MAYGSDDSRVGEEVYYPTWDDQGDGEEGSAGSGSPEWHN